MKFSQYVLVTECDDGLLLFNIRTSKYVKIKDKQDISHFEKLFMKEMLLDVNDSMVQALVQNGYIIDDNVDEYSEVKKDIEGYLGLYSKNLRILLYVTEQCNFRCIYCPEEHVNKHFSDENWNALYKHIENGIKNGEYNQIGISFFGGEPLLRANKIISFLEKLKTLKEINPEVVFTHKIVTNAYLLEPDLYDKLVSLDILQYQITLDGFADAHNTMRPLAGGQESWNKIVENLKYINERNDAAKIHLRTNFNDINIDSLKDFKEWQKNVFTNKKFVFYYYPVSEFSEKVPEELVTNKDTEKSLEVIEKLNNGLSMLEPNTGVCNSVLPNRYTISVDGKISICENLSERTDCLFVGHLDKTGKFVLYDNYKDWVSNFELDSCRECLLYPICCARTCPAKKVLTSSREDCKYMQSHFEKRILHFLQNEI